MQAKTIFSLTLAVAASLAGTLPAQAADVGVSIGISQPGVYGRIDIGRFPQPVLVVQQPVIIERPAVYAATPPVYLWVPPGHQKNWRKHCSQYNACGQPVYFVQDNWYRERGPGREVNPAYRDDRGQGYSNDHDHDHGKGHGKDKDKGKDKGHGKGRD